MTVPLFNRLTNFCAFRLEGTPYSETHYSEARYSETRYSETRYFEFPKYITSSTAVLQC